MAPSPLCATRGSSPFGALARPLPPLKPGPREFRINVDLRSPAGAIPDRVLVKETSRSQVFWDYARRHERVEISVIIADEVAKAEIPAFGILG
jgi:hypothetical protein